MKPRNIIRFSYNPVILTVAVCALFTSNALADVKLPNIIISAGSYRDSQTFNATNIAHQCSGSDQEHSAFRIRRTVDTTS